MAYRWKPSASQRRAFAEKMKDPDEQAAYNGWDNLKKENELLKRENEKLNRSVNGLLETGASKLSIKRELELKAINEEMKDSLKALYDLAEEMGMIMTSNRWSEKFRNHFNPVMTKAESILNKLTK